VRALGAKIPVLGPDLGEWSIDRKEALAAKLCLLAKPLAGDRIVRVRSELSE